jgi:hypothetical protein
MPIPLLALADRPVAAARLFTPRISFLPLSEQQPNPAWDVRVRGQEWQRCPGAPNEFRAREWLFLRNPRVPMHQIEARPAVDPLETKELA